MSHIPVLLNEVIEKMNPALGEVFVDGTLGNAGHSKEIGMRLGKGGLLIGIDQDQMAILNAKKNLAEVPCKVSLLKGNFRHITELLKTEGVTQVDGILLDIGFSSDQLEHSGRGLSFQKDEPLLMTLSDNPGEQAFTATDMVNDWDEENLADVIYAYGEEGFARKIAKAIVEARKESRIETTGQLLEVIRSGVPVWYTKKRMHFATKTFQALRIAVNDELGALKEGLEKSFGLLNVGGRLGVISFHSLEARIVKEFMNSKKAEGVGDLVTKRAVQASREEELSNPRSRSAQLRVIKKI